jgi:hypothetical protein
MRSNHIVSYKEAISSLSSIRGWKDADEQIVLCQQKIEELEAKAEVEEEIRERREARLAILIVTIPCAIMLFVYGIYGDILFWVIE